MPAALTAIRTSPGPTGGSGRSWTWRTSGPPTPVWTTARIGGGRYRLMPDDLAAASEVSARPADADVVLAGPAVDDVVSGAAVDLVVARPAEQHVVSRLSDQLVASGA